MNKVIYFVVALTAQMTFAACHEKVDYRIPPTQPAMPGNVYRTGWMELPEEIDGEGELYYAYHMRADAPKIRNYSVCYSAEYNCPVWAAMPMHPSLRSGSAGGRNDNWNYDPIIPRNVQPNLSSSYKDRSGNNPFSRGHMVASDDRQVSSQTNAQTFYYTNMAPQIQNEFNGGIWLSLEDLVQDTYICSDTLYVVTGSYWANTSTTCFDNSGKTITVPTHFYKVMIRSKSGSTGKPLRELSASEIQCVGFWLPHDKSAGTGTKNKLKTSHLMSVAEVERRTGLTFFSNVPGAPKDSFNQSDWGF